MLQMEALLIATVLRLLHQTLIWILRRWQQHHAIISKYKPPRAATLLQNTA
jgi:hypothetical protein